MYIMLSKEVFYFSYQANKSTCSELIAMKRGILPRNSMRLSQCEP